MQSVETYSPLNMAFSFLNSSLRICATIIVFLFHCNGLHAVPENSNLTFAFSSFLFLSGYYCLNAQMEPSKWFFRRAIRIYYPYWITCVVVLAANVIFSYKPVTAVNVISLFAGANLFIDEPVYVIGWFVSCIVVFYISVFLFYSFKNLLIKLIVIITGYSFLSDNGIPDYFFVFFFIGCIASTLVSRCRLTLPLPNSLFYSLFSKLSSSFLAIQNYSYEFFLIHGAVILMFTKIIEASYIQTLAFGFLVSALLAVLLKKITSKLIMNH